MRLKEPLYGVRVAGMHFVFHLGLVVTMIFTKLKDGTPLPTDCKH